MPGKKYRSIKRPSAYEALREKGYSKERAAKIANAGKEKVVRKKASRKKKTGRRGY